MGLFSRRRSVENTTSAAPEETDNTAQGEEFDQGQGPFDVADVPDSFSKKLIDLGALRIPAAKGLQVRLENGKQGKGGHAVVLVLGGSSLELRVFAAPRTLGIWDELRAEIAAELEKNHARQQEVDGDHGVEILAHLPVQGKNSASEVPVRFIGVDGPRWFLRGVFNGRAAANKEAANDLQEIFNSTVVVRGDAAMPPREPLELRPPNVKQKTNLAKPTLPLEPGPTIAEVR